MTPSVQPEPPDLPGHWPVHTSDGGTYLTTGQVVDALEVPSPAGIVACHLWHRQHARFAGDELPPLPDPERSLIVLDSGDTIVFLAASGGCPWPAGGGAVTSYHRDRPDLPTVRWHGPGSRVALPPSEGLAWLQPPGPGSATPNAYDLLQLLTSVVSMLTPGHTALDMNGARIIPATCDGDPQASASLPPLRHRRPHPGHYL